MVVVVWGIVAFKIVSALNPDLPQTKSQTMALNPDFKIETTVDTFSLHKVNRDPFLGTVYVRPAKKEVIYKQPEITWKQIDYQGYINKENKKQGIFIVTINKQQYLYKKGQTIDSVTLISGSAKHIKMRYKNNIKSFALKTES